MTKQRWIQAAFLLLFLGAMAAGRVQLWMGVFLGGMVGALFFSRFYCGWICPINTLMEVVAWFYCKTGIKRKPVPGWVKSPVVRYGMLAVFVGILAMTLRTGRRLPVLPALLVLGVFLSLIYVPVMWHRYLCPYGTLLGFPGAFAKTKWLVNTEPCNGCGLCSRVCPAKAVTVGGTPKKAVINPALCLACTACAQACPTNAIVYERGKV
ncbi:MAG: 4Fe-4S binding protein [Bacillota bacterium]|nr:4Fe-4S binding protein [Bacillota bacterium]MDW7676407.1 4Fe-4S binding protein [Bacillota bacterium]